MLSQDLHGAGWSDELGRALLASLELGQLVDLRAELTGIGEFSATGSAAHRMGELIELAREDPRLQRRIMDVWRSSHAALVAAVELVSVETSREKCEAVLGQFEPELVLLELITDTRDAGWELAEWVVASLPSPEARSALSSRLKQLAAPRTSVTSSSEPELRIVIFGGHPRDESKMSRRLFDGSPFDVRWKPCEKHQSSPDDRTLTEAMAHADGVILVTSMVSHNVMHLVKRYVQQQGIPWKVVTKATDLQLKLALHELFPAQMPQPEA